MITEPQSWDRRRAISFWWLAGLLVAFLAGAGAPSPLYPIYQATFGLTPLSITAMYAVFAAGGVAGLLVAGRSSDYVGRRRVIAGSIALQLLALACFLSAQGELPIYVGRLVDGLGVGIGVGALSAWLVDLQPPGNQRLGGLISSSSVMLGLGVGAFGSGLLVEFGPLPTQAVYLVLATVLSIGLAALPFLPDLSPRRSGWFASLRPDVAVPAAARHDFAVALPSLVATWALGGLFLSLGPSLAISLMHRASAAAGGLVIFLLLAVGAIASIAVRDRPTGRLIAQGSALLIAGVVVTLVGLLTEQALVLLLGSFIAGLGLGSAFSAAVRRLAPLAPPDRRAALLAAIFVTVYVSFSVPAIIAGIFTNTIGLRPTAYGYGLIVGALAAITTILVRRRERAEAS